MGLEKSFLGTCFGYHHLIIVAKKASDLQIHLEQQHQAAITTIHIISSQTLG
jgi:hypothetical protein